MPPKNMSRAEQQALSSIDDIVDGGFRLEKTNSAAVPYYDRAVARNEAMQFARGELTGPDKQRVLMSLNQPTETQQALQTLESVRKAFDSAIGPLLQGPAVQDPGPLQAAIPQEAPPLPIRRRQ